MAKPSAPKGKAPLVFAGIIALLVVATFGIAMKNIVLTKSGQGSKADVTAAKVPQQRPVKPKPAVVESNAPDPTPEEKAKASSIADNFRVKRVLDVKGPLRHGDYMWDDKNIPAGPLVVTVDLKAQTLSVFRGGYEIGVAVILYGATDKPSPLGVFPITQKDADHISNLYDAPMPYMLRLTNDGVAIHGSDVKWGNATHGCIGVPTAFAKKLFDVAKLGDVVIITDGKMMNLG